MADPLLSSLCRICNIQTPKYTCPRCSLQTCSLACSRRHKLWSSCNGERDPTVFKPQSQLATPAGIDHDYNFLHGIEHRIERSEKEIIEERGLVDRKELELARRGEDPRLRRRQRNETAGQVQIQRALNRMGTVVERAPKGIQRNRENGTTWSRNQKCIHWQVEWICAGELGRSLGKAIGKNPIGEVYMSFVEERRKLKMTDEEKRVEKKRKAVGLKRRLTKKAKSDEPPPDPTPTPMLQDPETGSWSFTSGISIQEMAHEELTAPEPTPSLSHHLYLLRPHIPSSFPKVLCPLEPSKSLDHHLQRRVLLEFPTIYVLESRPEDLPEQFMLEGHYLAETGQKPLDVDMGGGLSEDEEMASTGNEDETSSSESNEDEEMEDGEIV